MAGVWAVPAALVFSRSYEKEDPGRLRGQGLFVGWVRGWGWGALHPTLALELETSDSVPRLQKKFSPSSPRGLARCRGAALRCRRTARRPCVGWQRVHPLVVPLEQDRSDEPQRWPSRSGR